MACDFDRLPSVTTLLRQARGETRQAAAAAQARHRPRQRPATGRGGARARRSRRAPPRSSTTPLGLLGLAQKIARVRCADERRERRKIRAKPCARLARAPVRAPETSMRGRVGRVHGIEGDDLVPGAGDAQRGDEQRVLRPGEIDDVLGRARLLPCARRACARSPRAAPAGPVRRRSACRRRAAARSRARPPAAGVSRSGSPTLRDDDILAALARGDGLVVREPCISAVAADALDQWGEVHVAYSCVGGVNISSRMSAPPWTVGRYVGRDARRQRHRHRVRHPGRAQHRAVSRSRAQRAAARARAPRAGRGLRRRRLCARQRPARRRVRDLRPRASPIF